MKPSLEFSSGGFFYYFPTRNTVVFGKFSGFYRYYQTLSF